MDTWIIIGIAAAVLGVLLLVFGLARIASESDDRMDEEWLRRFRKEHPYHEP